MRVNATARDRGQAYSLEGIIGAIIIVSALVIGLQAAEPSPWATNGAEQQAEDLRTQVEDVLDAAGEDGLRTAITCVTNSVEGDRDPAVGAPSSNATEFNRILNRSLVQPGYEYTLVFEWLDASGDQITTEQVYPDDPQTPGDGAVSSTRTILLSEGDRLYTRQPAGTDETCQVAQRTPNTLAATDRSDLNFYIDEQVGSNDDIYALVRVRVVAW
ncbi:DUF7288 family protein [Halovenus marina]|uniref:DUF7288 family protein n=1 Tax=Halovenus marina TaxID=3396621 RepID=UPI003F574897